MNHRLKYLDKFQNWLLMAIFACTILIFLDVGFFSVSFIFGTILIFYSFGKDMSWFKPHGLMLWLTAYVIIAYISLVFTDVSFTGKHLQRCIQLLYWLMLAVFVYNAYPVINKFVLSRIVGISVVILILIDVTIMPMTQNGVAFSCVILGPIGYYGLKRYWVKVIYALLLLVLMIFNGSRTGFVLCFCESVLFFLFFTPVLRRYVRLFLIFGVVLFFTLNVEMTRIAIGNIVMPLNERVGMLLKDPDAVFRNDTSWLQRKAQVEKGKQIFEMYPWFGVGFTNFVNYDVLIDISRIDMDRKSIRNIDNRSSHNSYIGLIAETGIFGIGVVLLMFSSALIMFVRRLNSLGGTFEACVFISLIGMLIYFYTISSFLGTASWIMYGMICGAAVFVNNKKITI